MSALTWSSRSLRDISASADRCRLYTRNGRPSTSTSAQTATRCIPPAQAEVRQEDLSVGHDAAADQHRVAEVLSAPRMHRRRVVDVAQAEAAGDGVDARRIHLLERDHVGAAQVLVRADRGQRSVDVRGVADVEGSDAQAGDGIRGGRRRPGVTRLGRALVVGGRSAGGEDEGGRGGRAHSPRQGFMVPLGSPVCARSARTSSRKRLGPHGAVSPYGRLKRLFPQGEIWRGGRDSNPRPPT